jgi:DNA-binding LacI/PurR family transcriptional regulator
VTANIRRMARLGQGEQVQAHRRPRATKRRGAVIADVARVAGVSHQTVSRVLNDSPQVTAQTRARVLSAMRELDYRPNSAARALATGRSKTLGVVSFDTTLYGPASTLFAIEQTAHDAGYFITVASVKSITRASVLNAVERLRHQAVDGIVVIAPTESAARALLHLSIDVPVVAVEGGPDATVPVVAVDQRAGAARATQHLLDLGHRTVWHLAGPSDWLEAQQRMEGWRSTLVSAGAEIPEPLLGDWSARSGYELGRRLADEPELTAIFVANDQMALGMLRVLHEAGRHVPRDVSIVGFDDVPEAGYFTPPLTTVRQDFGEVGRRSLDLLLHQLGSSTRVWSRQLVPAELIVRESATAMRARG